MLASLASDENYDTRFDNADRDDSEYKSTQWQIFDAR
jgi:hypothetical protein